MPRPGDTASTAVDVGSDGRLVVISRKRSGLWPNTTIVVYSPSMVPEATVALDIGAREVAFAADGSFFVLDNTPTIQHFASHGAKLHGWGGTGSEPGQFADAQGFGVAPDGTVWVADTGNQRVQVFEPNGAYLGEWTTGDPATGEALDPTDVAIAPDGTAYVAFGESRSARYGRLHAYPTRAPAVWRLELYRGEWLSGVPVAVEQIAAPAVDWGEAAPVPELPPDGFSARIEGLVEIAPGRYRIAAEANGGLRLWLDDRLAVDAWNATEVRAVRAIDVDPRTAPARVYAYPAESHEPVNTNIHRFRMEYRDPGLRDARVALTWRPWESAFSVYVPVAAR